jgi:hypothetical protein
MSKYYLWKLENNDEKFHYTDESILSLTSKPFLWPGRIICMEYISRMLSNPYYEVLITVFLPKLQDKSMREASTSTASKHLTLIQHFGDPYFRDISLNVVINLIEKCVRKILGERSMLATSDSLVKFNNVSDEKLLCEALIHEIIKRLFDFMKSVQNAYTDILETSIMVFQKISCLLLLSSDSFIFQRLLENYGTCNREHELFNWKRTRPHICKELLVNVEHILKQNVDKDDTIKFEMLHTTLEFLKNFMLGNDITKQSFKFAMIQGSKVYNSSIIKRQFEYGDVFNVIFAVEKIPSLKTIVSLME